MSSFSGSVVFSRGGSVRRGAALVLSCLTLLPSALAAQQSAPVAPEAGCPAIPRAAAGGIPAVDHVRYLADNALQGREVGTAGERCSAAYIATRFAELGLRAAGTNGTWYQTFPVRSGSTLGRAGTLAISGQPREHGKAWAEYGFSGTGDASGRLAYAGPGVPPAQGQPADEYAALDLRGRVAVVEASWPGVTGTRADAHYKAIAVQSRGAVGMIVLLPDGRALPSLEDENRPFARIPVAAVAAPDAESIRAAARTNAQARLTADVRANMVEGRNVLALLPGSDPRLAEETLVIGAHHDHLGLGGEGSLAPGAREIHNGADDNASGSASLIQIAKRLLDGPRPGALRAADRVRRRGARSAGVVALRREPAPPARQDRRDDQPGHGGAPQGRRAHDLRDGHRNRVGRHDPAAQHRAAPAVHAEPAARRLRPVRPFRVLRQGHPGAALLHRHTRRVPPSRGRHSAHQRRRHRARRGARGGHHGAADRDHSAGRSGAHAGGGAAPARGGRAGRPQRRARAGLWAVLRQRAGHDAADVRRADHRGARGKAPPRRPASRRAT